MTASRRAMYRIGIDVGGTFTDIVVVDGAGRLTLTKVMSTPADPSIGVLDGVGRAAAALDMRREDFLAATQIIVHGTTVATNALLESKGARIGMLTTEGHRDVIEMREGYKDDRYNLRLSAPEPLVPRKLRLAVRERIRPDGSVDTPLDVASLDQAISRLAEAQVESVAICFLHAYGEPRHELMAEASVRAALPEAYLSISSQVLPQINEFQRFSTTVVNAFVGPVLARYLQQLERRFNDAGYAGPVLIMQSHGGISPVAEAMRLAAGSVLSGPAGGVAGSRHCATLLCEPNLITFDMGGTSTDISLIVDGECQVGFDRGVGGHRVALPSLEILTLGAGGGSIARVEASGILRVGPQSAGARPGPACYGHGGADATVTDANVVLGLLDERRFAGGELQLDRAAAEAVVAKVAARLSTDIMTAAQGIVTVVNTTMAEGIRLVSVKRGLDPRKFALLSFGGAAGLHITDIARRLDIGRVVVPRVASLLSAWGMLHTDLRYEVVKTHIGDVRVLGPEELSEVLRQIETEGRERLGQGFGGDICAQTSVDMRYGEQAHTINVSLDGVAQDDPSLLTEAVRRFHDRHEELYTYSQRDHDVTLVTARVAVIGALPPLPDETFQRSDTGATAMTNRLVYVDGWREVPVYGIGGLELGQCIGGPAIIEAPTTTILLLPGDQASVNSELWLDISVPTH